MKSYQVVVLGDDVGEAGRFRHTLARHFAELHIDTALLSVLSGADMGKLDPTSPVVGVYFGVTPFDGRPTPEVDELLGKGYVVIPAVYDLEHYSTYVPGSLGPINGQRLRLDDPDQEVLCSVVLENLSLLRKSRRVFISYRRVESRNAAIQLYEELDSRTFDVFLDTHSIRPGDEFQNVLWHRLADTDVMVLLDTPEFLGSVWTYEELARANSTSLQILQVVWPDRTQEAEAALCVEYPLQAGDFTDKSVTCGSAAHLHQAVIGKIAMQVESLRARALAARHAFLVQEIQREASAIGLAFVAQPGRYIELSREDGRSAIIVPTVGVPDAVRYQEIEERMADHGTTELILAFDARGVLQRWLKHLEWLETSIRVQSVRIADIHDWMLKRFS